MGPFRMTTALRTEQLVIGHRHEPLIAPVDLHFGSGQLVALIGVNGSGKTTLLRTIAGLHPAISGRVLIQDRDMARITAMERARSMSVVLTGRTDMGLLDVRTLVSLGRQPWTGRLGLLTAKDRERVQLAMERTGVDRFEHRALRALSDGELQLVLIARALAQDTPVMLLDEPTAYLDVVNRVRLVALLRDVAHSTGTLVLLSTHDLQTALELADRSVLITGREAIAGTPSELLAAEAVQRAFATSGMRFDPVTGSFKAVR